MATLTMPNHPDDLIVVKETDFFVAVDYGIHLPTKPNTKWKIRKLNTIKKVIFHHTAGNYLDPPEHIDASNQFIINEKGWHKLPYHIMVSYNPVILDDGRPVIYLINEFNTITAHTKGGNVDGIGIVCQGNFSIKEGLPGEKNQPSIIQMGLVESIWEDWLKPEFNFENKNVRGHFDYTKPACPGGTLKKFVQNKRGFDKIK